ncbi:MAG: DUF4349 domain-containing protein [Candidatus Zixiibacteriota bacterium]|jgi:hypothetical protein
MDELGLEEERGGDVSRAPSSRDGSKGYYARGGGGMGLGGGVGGIAGLRGPGLGGGRGVVADIGSPGSDLDSLADEIADSRSTGDLLKKRAIIKTGTLLIHVDDVDDGLERVHEVVAAYDGELVKVERRKYEDEDNCTVAVRVPAGRFDAAMSSAQEIGDVVELLVEAEDVTEEYVDLQMRLDNQLEARDRFIEILNTRTGKLEDVVALQREINNTTEEMERLAGKILYLQNRAAYSTIYITLHKPTEKAPAGKEDKPSIFQQVFAALAEAVGALFGIVLFLVQVAIVAVPLALTAFLVVLAGRRGYLWARRREVGARLFGRTSDKKE